MRVLDVSFPEPERNLALDEALLNRAEEGECGESLRFWESPSHFVVLGVAQALSKEVQESACNAVDIPILRRCSAGGCVLQGPGCLNFSLVLDTAARPEIRTIRSSYSYILRRISGALGMLGAVSQCSGTSDLAIDEMKISGNAQRRRKQFILHHGTLLYGLDLSLVTLCLSEPSRQPDYRRGREHADFISNLSLSRENLVAALSSSFAGSLDDQPLMDAELAEVAGLVGRKYGSLNWIRRR